MNTIINLYSQYINDISLSLFILISIINTIGFLSLLIEFINDYNKLTLANLLIFIFLFSICNLPAVSLLTAIGFLAILIIQYSSNIIIYKK